MSAATGAARRARISRSARASISPVTSTRPAAAATASTHDRSLLLRAVSAYAGASGCRISKATPSHSQRSPAMQRLHGGSGLPAGAVMAIDDITAATGSAASTDIVPPE